MCSVQICTLVEVMCTWMKSKKSPSPRHPSVKAWETFLQLLRFHNNVHKLIRLKYHYTSPQFKMFCKQTNSTYSSMTAQMCTLYIQKSRNKIMQKGFILRGGCSETDFQSTHHYCSTHEANKITTQPYMRSKCMHGHSEHSVYVYALGLYSKFNPLVQGFLDQETVF